MKLRCHKNFCQFVHDRMAKSSKKVYIFRRRTDYNRRWWMEPQRHVRLTFEGIVKAMRGSCAQGYAQVFEVDLEKLTIKKIFDGENR